MGLSFSNNYYIYHLVKTVCVCVCLFNCTLLIEKQRSQIIEGVLKNSYSETNSRIYPIIQFEVSLLFPSQN